MVFFFVTIFIFVYVGEKMGNSRTLLVVALLRLVWSPRTSGTEKPTTPPYLQSGPRGGEASLPSLRPWRRGSSPPSLPSSPRRSPPRVAMAVIWTAPSSVPSGRTPGWGWASRRSPRPTGSHRSVTCMESSIGPRDCSTRLRTPPWPRTPPPGVL